MNNLEKRTLNYELFPPQLSEWPKRPEILWYEGNLNLLNLPMVSVVGSRDVTPEGIARTRKLTKLLVSKGICVVSGLAEGVDACAHSTTLESGGATIAVMGTSIDECYPSKHKHLKLKIEQKGLVISQFSPGLKIQRSNFPRRNEVMSALSIMTIVIEAKIDSGTRHQVKSAIKLRRQVGFLSSLVDCHFPWVDEAIETGFGFSISSPEDLLVQLDKLLPVQQDISKLIQEPQILTKDASISFSPTGEIGLQSFESGPVSNPILFDYTAPHIKVKSSKGSILKNFIKSGLKYIVNIYILFKNLIRYK